MDTFKDVPEFFEVELGECISARTETLASFRELGPPDLCHVVKTTGRAGQKDIGSYHYVSGVDASSSASLAAYLNSLTYALESDSGWFAKGTSWKLRVGSYCCYNAFSRLDVRVDVKIPGGVQAYAIDLRGDRHEATPAIWQEAYLSALLRAIHYADDPNYRLAGYRKLDPITTPEGETRFLQTAEAMFQKGWQLGSDPEIQVASPVSNHLTSGILKYFGASGRFAPAVNLFERMYVREPEVASLLATSYIGMNEEIKALQTLASALESSRPPNSQPPSYTLLHVQCDLVRQKGKKEWAVALARQAVNVAPSEFVTWAKLTECYIENGQFESALLTLNSCPMFTYNERDLHRMPTPARTHLPVRDFIRDSGILDEDSARDNEADIALLRLPAPSLRGTFAKAYALLTKLAAEVGWDELLRKRSAVFVMEEEYRNVKMRGGNQNESNGDDRVVHEDGTVTTSRSANDEDDSSTRALHRATSPALSAVSESDVPTIKVTDDETDVPTIKVSEHTDDTASGFGVDVEGLEKPEKAGVEGDADDKASIGGGKDRPAVDETMSFSTKRLCERWLDNLFMVLYEDLRIWTIFRAEVAHFKTQRVAYKKTGTEWEILGDLGARLHHKEDAKEAYTRCLEQKFSAKAWMRLLEIYADEGDLQRGLNAAFRIACYQWRWYMESTYPTAVAQHLFKLGQTHGHAKLSYTLMSMGLPDGVLAIMQGYLNYGRTFKPEGWDF
ncbi:hypothetical protein RhiJN_24095 [Ceratobasidium sp. AG-Ba]|nr:hypothetical protein RhiJN_24095 [Ceratobasidium sp. AG-Ba]